MDITKPKILKLKGLLFLFLGLLSAGLILYESFSLRTAVLLGISIWAFCRFYYFAFYVLHHYADPKFNYAGLGSLIKYVFSKKV